MEAQEPGPRPWTEKLKPVLWGIVLLPVCIALDVFLHKTGLVKQGYSHPHGFGTPRMLFGWFFGWAISWPLMRLSINAWVWKFGPRRFKHFERAGIWALIALFVLLVLPDGLVSAILF